MFDTVRINRHGECEVCGVAHDEGIHQATLSIHNWLREQVTQYFPVEEPIAEVQVA